MARKIVTAIDVVVNIQDAIHSRKNEGGSIVVGFVSGTATVRVEVLEDVIREAAHLAIKNAKKQCRRGGIEVKLVRLDETARYQRTNGGPKQPCN